MVRLLPDGTLDSAFGAGGTVTLALGGSFEQVSSLAVEPDGDIVVAGYVDISSKDDPFVARLLPNGSLDASFGGGPGYVVTTLLTGNQELEKVAVQGDGKILLGGAFGILGYNADGTTDTTWGSAGLVATSSESSLVVPIVGLCVEPDGPILAAGQVYNGTDYKFIFLRYTTAGAIVNTETTDFGANDLAKGIALSDNGEVAIAGYTGAVDGSVYDFAAWQISVNGDPTASVQGPSVGANGVPISLTLGAVSASLLAEAAGFTYQVNWGDQTGVQTIQGLDGLQVPHTYAADGDYVIQVTATDVNGLTSAVSSFGVSILNELGTDNLLEGPAAGGDSVIVTAGPWTATSNASWLHTSASDTGGGQATFTFDANPGATRTGTLTIAGLTVTVTQAGSSYAASNPVATLVGTGLSDPGAVAVDGAGNVYFADTGDNAIKEWDAATQQVTTVVATGLDLPLGVAVDGAGNIYIGDYGDQAIKEWNPTTQQLTTLVATGLDNPEGVAVDSAGNVYIADTFNNEIKEWNAATQQVTTLVSSGLNLPIGVAVDSAGNVYIADSRNVAIKEWNASTQQVTTLVSSGLGFPTDVAVDAAGNVYVADYSDNAIREWNADTQQLTTLVSTGLNLPRGIAVDGVGNLYVADSSDNAIKELVRAYVPTSAVGEPATAGSDSLAVVLPASQSLTGVFAPTSDQSWLSIGTVANGVVNFSFAANTTGADRTAHITVLGQQITVTQAAVYTVTNTSSDPTVAGSLPWAVVQADADTSGSVATIDFAAGPGQVFAAPQTITLAGGLNLDNTTAGESIVIDGPAAGVTLAGGGSASEFTVVYVSANTTATIENLSITDGYAGGGTSYEGGGIYNSGTLTVLGSTIFGNNASGGAGGGIVNFGSLAVSESTIADNTAANGGGVYNFAQLTISNSTVTGNSANFGGGINNGFGTLTMYSTIVAGNTAGTAPDINGPDSGSYNLVGDGFDSYGLASTNFNQVGTGANPIAAYLGALGDYGGPTDTVPLLPGSPAIGAGGAVSGITADQRGFPLPANNPDIGAFQDGGFTISVQSGNNQAVAIDAAFNPLQVSVTADNAGDPVDGGVVTFTINPNGGAGATLSSGTAIIAAGVAGVAPTANATAGAYSVTAAAAGASAASFNLTNNKGSQSISFNPLGPVTYGNAPIVLGATASSGLPISYTVASGPGSITNNTLTIAGAGTIVIQASQAGNANYSAAAPVLQSLVVGKATDAINFPVMAAVPLGGTVALDATGGGSTSPLIYTIVTGSAAIDGNEFTGKALGLVFVEASQAGDSNYSAATAVFQSIQVEKAQTITFTQPASPIAFGAAVTLTASANSGLPVTLSIASGPATITSGKLTVTGVGSIVVNASQAGNSTYAAATPVQRTIVVNPANQTITFNQPPAVKYGVGTVNLSATVTSGLAVRFAITGGTGTGIISGDALTVTGAGTIIIQASQPGNADYNAAMPVTRTLTVNKAGQTIAFSTPTAITFGAGAIPLSSLGATATSGLAVTYTVVSGPGTISGNNLLINGAGTIMIKASQSGNSNYSAASAVTRSLAVNKESQSLTFNTLSPVTYGNAPIVLGATVSSGLAITYTVVSGPGTISGNTLTIKGAGSVVIKASQAGNANFNAATAVSQTLTVNKEVLTVTANNVTWTAGIPKQRLTFSITGFVGTDTQASIFGSIFGSEAPALSTTPTVNASNPAAGTYTINIAQGTLITPANYVLDFVPGELMVNP